MQLIEQFKGIIEGVIEMEDPEIRNRCLKILLKHGEAVEMLAKYQPMSEFFKDLRSSFEKDLSNRFLIYPEGELRKNEYGLTLSPREWRVCAEYYTHVNYFIFSTPKRSVCCGLWACLEHQHEYGRRALENLEGEIQKDVGWDNIIYYENTGVTLPTDFSLWDKAIEGIKGSFLKFLDRFSVSKIEQLVPDVKKVSQ